jgi:hypothetical protein
MNQTTKQEIQNALNNFFPRIIREFDDHDEPMVYGGKWS